MASQMDRIKEVSFRHSPCLSRTLYAFPAILAPPKQGLYPSRSPFAPNRLDPSPSTSITCLLGFLFKSFIAFSVRQERKKKRKTIDEFNIPRGGFVSCLVTDDDGPDYRK